MQDEVLDLTVVVPAYNPDEKLQMVVKRLKERGFHDIIVVNDGSDEEHMKPFLTVEGDATVIHFRKNKGKGIAIKTAFAFCRDNRTKSKGVMIVEWDNAYHPDDVYACGKALFEHRGHLILGCRNYKGEGISLRNKLLNGIKKGIFRLFCGLKVSDTQAGVRAFEMSQLAQIMEIKGEREEFETNMLINAKNLELPIIEVPIRTLSA